MIRDIYVYFNDIEYLREFRYNPLFVCPHEYDREEYHKCLKEEFGKFRLNNGISLRLIYDTGRETKCPWCAHPEPEIQKIECFALDLSRVFAECPNCLARGPVLNVNADLLHYHHFLDEYKEFVRQRWSTRLPKAVTPPPSTVLVNLKL